MGLIAKLNTSNTGEVTPVCLITDGKAMCDPALRSACMPAEWWPQSGVQLTWPHAGTDWRDMMGEVTECYIRMAYEISVVERLLIVTPEPDAVKALLVQRLPQTAMDNISFVSCPTNDTWARDHGFLTVINNDRINLLDFTFNGWGNKFEAALDNAINARLAGSGTVKGDYVDCLDMVLEGGSIESDGCGTLLTTSQCLLSKERNPQWSRADIEEQLKRRLHSHRVLWLDHGNLIGDDTDGHIDTLARFCPGNVIAYVKCDDESDPQYGELLLMERQLQGFLTDDGHPYTLLPLPMASPLWYDGERLPATYANFLIINQKVLVPTYADAECDRQAIAAIQKAFPRHEIVGIDCRVLTRQHGSLHCCTMQFPRGVL